MSFYSQNKIARYVAKIALCFLLLSAVAFSFGPVYAQQEGQRQAAGATQNPQQKNSKPLDVKETTGQWIGNSILDIAALVTGLGGSLLDSAVKQVVLDMGKDLKSDASVGNSVNRIWTVIRDFANLFFIFALVYIGIRTIYDYESGETKKILAAVIIGALLINFSLLITKVVIDVGNVLAVQIYESGLNVNAGTNGAGGQIAANLVGHMQLKSIYDASGNELGGLTTAGTFGYYFGAAIFMLIAAFVFAAGAILLVIRYVALILAMVFSPLLFALSAFPQLSKHSSWLWHQLFSYTFFAPLYFFLLYVSIKLIEGMQASVNPGGFFSEIRSGAGVNLVQTDTTSVILNFVIIIIFLIASLVFAQKLGIYGGTQTVKVMQNIRGRVQRGVGNATVGGAAAIGRSTVGRWGQKAKDDEGLKERAANSWLARQQLKFANYSSKASFDARQVAGAGKKMGIGEGKKGGYDARVKAAQKKEDEVAKMLGQVPDDDVRVKAQQSEVERIEGDIRTARAERDAATTPAAKKAAADNIAKLERDLQKQKDKVEQEKNRRVIGSSFVPEKIAEAIKEQDELIKEEEKKIRDAAKAYFDASSDADRKQIEESAKVAQKNIENARAKQMDIKREEGVPTGYSDTVEQRGWTSSQITGRNKGINRTAGKKLRKEWSKKIKGSSDGTGGNKPEDGNEPESE